MKYIQRPGNQRSLNEVAKVLGVNVVQIGLDDGDGVALPIKRGRLA